MNSHGRLPDVIGVGWPRPQSPAFPARSAPEGHPPLFACRDLGGRIPDVARYLPVVVIGRANATLTSSNAVRTSLRASSSCLANFISSFGECFC